MVIILREIEIERFYASIPSGRIKQFGLEEERLRLFGRGRENKNLMKGYTILLWRGGGDHIIGILRRPRRLPEKTKCYPKNE